MERKAKAAYAALEVAQAQLTATTEALHQVRDDAQLAAVEAEVRPACTRATADAHAVAVAVAVAMAVAPECVSSALTASSSAPSGGA